MSGAACPSHADRVVITSGTSEGIELALGALADAGDEVLVPTPTYPLYTAVLAKIGARAAYYRTDPSRGWEPDLDDVKRRLTRATRAIVVIDPNNPTGAVVPRSHAPRADRSRRARRRADPRRRGLLGSRYDGPTPLLAKLAPDAAILSFSSLSKAFVAPGWRAGWLCVGRTDRLDDVLAAIKKLADGRLCSPGPMQYGIEAALTGDRSHQRDFVRELRVRADLTMARLGKIPGLTCVAPHAAFYVMPKVALPDGVTDEDFVIGLLRATGILCVYGSGFGMPADQGFFRIVFLAPPDELGRIYDDLASFTADFLANGAGSRA